MSIETIGHNCPACGRGTDTPITGICTSCEMRTSQLLSEIPTNAIRCNATITPQRGNASGTITTTSKPPVNLTTLAYATNLGYSISADGNLLERDGLGMLHAWEALIRKDCDLTPPALVPYTGSAQREITAVCRFLTTHLGWAAQQPWADELLLEVAEIHRAGLIALRAVPARRHHITCPGDLPEGGLCAAPITMPAPEDFADYVKQPGEHAPRKTLYCPNCLTAWTFERFLRVALIIDPDGVVRGFGKDFIAGHLGVTTRHINRLISNKRAG